MSTKSKQVAYANNMQAVNALAEDGAICNFYRKSYDETATANGGTGNRKVFKMINDEINEYQDVYKVLTGEQRAKITEEIPVIDYYTPENTGFLYHYVRDKNGVIQQNDIATMNLSSKETDPAQSLKYIEEEDPYIINRALLGDKSSMAQQFWNTNGKQMSDFNLLTTYRVKNGGVVYRYKGIYPKGAITYAIGDKTSEKEYRLENIHIFKTTKQSSSIVLTLTSTAKVPITLLNTDSNNYTVGIFLPGAAWREDPDRFVVLSCTNGQWSVENENQAYEITSYKDTSDFPVEVRPGDVLPADLVQAANFLSDWLYIEKESLSSVSGLLNGLYTQPYRFDDYITTKVSEWIFNDDTDLGKKSNLELPIGTKYYPAHLLHRGSFIPSPFATTPETDEDGYQGKLSYLTDKLSSSDSDTFFDPVEVPNWGLFTPSRVTVSNRESWTGKTRFEKDGEFITAQDFENIVNAWRDTLKYEQGSYLVSYDNKCSLGSHSFYSDNLIVGDGDTVEGQSSDISKTWNKFIWTETTRKRNLNFSEDWTYSVSINSLYEAYGATNTKAVLLYFSENTRFPKRLYLISSVDLGLEEFNPDEHTRGLCTFYTTDSKDFDNDKILCFKVAKKVAINYSNITQIRYGSHTFSDSASVNKWKAASTWVYYLDPYGGKTSAFTYHDHMGMLHTDYNEVLRPSLSYPQEYFELEDSDEESEDSFELKDPNSIATYFKWLNDSVIIPGLPQMDSYEDFRSFPTKTDVTPNINLGVFYRMINLGGGSAIAKISSARIGKIIDEWPLTYGRLPLRFGQLKDFLEGLLSLNNRLGDFSKEIPELDSDAFDTFENRLYTDQYEIATLGKFTCVSNITSPGLMIGRTFPETLDKLCNACTLTVKEQKNFTRKSIMYLKNALDNYYGNPNYSNAVAVDECLGNNTLAFLRLDAQGTDEELYSPTSEAEALYQEVQTGAQTIAEWAAENYFGWLMDEEIVGTYPDGQHFLHEDFANLVNAYEECFNQKEPIYKGVSEDKRFFFHETSNHKISSFIRDAFQEKIDKIVRSGGIDAALVGITGTYTSNMYFWEWVQDLDESSIDTEATLDKFIAVLAGTNPADASFTNDKKAAGVRAKILEVLRYAQTQIATALTEEAIRQRFVDYVNLEFEAEVESYDEAIQLVANSLTTFTTSNTGTATITIGRKSIIVSDAKSDLTQTADIKTRDLYLIANYIKGKLFGEIDSRTGQPVSGVEYLENGQLSGDSNSLYYKRYLILNDRMNMCSGTLTKASNFINNSSVYGSVNTFNEGKAASYADYVGVEPVAKMKEMYYMPKQISSSTQTEIFGKFYDKELLDSVKSYLGSNCVLTCTHCTVAESCPFYDINGVLDAWVPEKTTIDLSFKDNMLDLIYYDTTSPNLQVDGNGASLDPELIKKAHLPYVDIMHATNSSGTTDYEGADYHEVVESMNHVDLRDDLSEDNTGRIISGRYGTIGINPATQSIVSQEMAGDNVLLNHTYLYDALFISDAEELLPQADDTDEILIAKQKHNNARTCFNYRPSTTAYPVSVDYGYKHYTGTTKIQIPTGLKLLDNANPWDDVYLVSDDRNVEGIKTEPVIYIGSVSRTKQIMYMDLVETDADAEVTIYRDAEGKIRDTAQELYAKDVAQWSINYVKGNLENNPLGSNPNNPQENRDQYWMETLQKPVVFEGRSQYLECPGRPRVFTGFTEMVTDGSDITQGSLLSGKPFANNYIDFVRQVRIVFKYTDGNGVPHDLIKWSKNADDAMIKREMLPHMSTNLRLVIVKNEKPEGWADEVVASERSTISQKLNTSAAIAANKPSPAFFATWLTRTINEGSDAPASLTASLSRETSETTLDLFQKLTQGAQDLAEKLAAEQEVKEAAKEEFKEDPLGTVAEKAGDIAQGIVSAVAQGIWHDITNPIVETWNNVTEGVENAYNTVADAVTAAGEWVTDTATNVGNWVVDTATSVGNTIADAAETAWNGISDAANTVGNAASNAANWVGQRADEAGKTVKNVFNKLKFW